jgi:hypothetical protein
MMAGTASERIVVLMSPKEKAQLEARARNAKSSVGEFVRRSLAAYEPDAAEHTEFAALLDVFEETHRQALAALADAEKEVKKTRAYFAAKGGR